MSKLKFGAQGIDSTGNARGFGIFKMIKKAATSVFIWAVCVNPLMAGVTCLEEIVWLIVHVDGAVYFTTDQTCPSWCKLDWSNEDQVSRSYSMLLAAETLGKPVRFQWPDINACSETNVTYASPSYFMAGFSD